MVEGVAVDPSGGSCPTHTDFQVTPPDTSETLTVGAAMDTCELQIHPVGSKM